MAIAYPIDRPDRRYVVTTVDNGNFLVVGVASAMEASVWSIVFAPDDDFVGEFTVVARAQGKGAGDDAAGYGTIGYIRVQLNGAAADQGLTNDTIGPSSLATGHATIWVRATGLQIALATTCTAGTCTIYSSPHAGDVSPLSLVTG